jgi:molecular chaperone HscA
MLLGTQSALDADGDLLSPAERATVAALMDRLRTLAAGNDHRAIDDAVEALARGTEAFAAERMNRGIRQALAGRNINEV